MKKIVLLTLLFLSTFVNAQTFDIETIFQSGPNDSRINVVILSDGYQSNELGQFVTDATNFSNALFAETPYKEYKNYFNVHAIKVPSNESGANHPGTGTNVSEPAHPIKSVDNYFGSTFDAFGNHRLLVSNNATVFNVLANNFPSYDIVLVLVNSPYYGGSGGEIAVASLDVNSNQIAIHELGHSFVKLLDEYYATDDYLLEGINTTQETDPTKIKWTNWINKNGVGIYPYGETGTAASWYRPHQNCKMRRLNQPLCSVCTEATIEQIHSMTSPIDTYSPQNTGPIDLSTPIDFTINTINPLPNTLAISWTLNGTVVNSEDYTVSISKEDLVSGNNQLLATIEDKSALLKVDNHETIHFATTLWNINSSTLSIDDISTNSFDIKLFPNPTQDILYFDITNNNENYNVFISAISGKQLIQKKINNISGNQNIRIGALPSGVYFINFTFENGLKISKKIIKE
ncbi:M64 family metallopeptidase [Polaribacter sp. Q13]|uniref:T9SS type A sorting domain-containing protein n=1 Tax=Polaribacter sp. Q13 TaxID=2806551 RepID=UPI00193B64BF|nr:M64 family metallopeptidase [Polaribacter sp. Q13]QVY67080.1 T9SS type A sorting domain-containing protein [Polaribacter sp. Q13]